jgi:hypothetical protein
MKIILKILLLTSMFLIVPTGYADQQTTARPSEDQLLLKRIYELRMRFERERIQAENEARANVRLITQSPGARADSPTVTGLRLQTNTQLARFEQQFRCLDVDVESNSGNTVVICGDNSGDISGTNVSAGRDIVTIQEITQ